MKCKNFAVIVCIFMTTLGLTSNLMAGVYINCNFFEGTFDDAGFSDVINWGGYPNNVNHPYNLHEVLSGEWGAAVFYDGLSTEPNAMWLTPEFLYPYWYTNSTFYTTQSGNNYDNPNNPVSGYDTGQSKIVSGDGKMEITIDYEIVDLGDGNFSPLAITDSNYQTGFVRSDRYLFLQTYTIKANSQNEDDITGLEFYQLLHSHGADEYAECVNASYTAANYDDPLVNYIPHNSVHQTGNFMYDFTQWNNLNDPQAGASHTDYVGFGCTVAPDVYDCNFYEGHSYSIYKPPFGTHTFISRKEISTT